MNQPASSTPRRRILTLFGTRPEIIKLAPVIHALEAEPDFFETQNVTSGQHADLLHPFAKEFQVRIDADLAVATANQTPLDVCQRILAKLQPLVQRDRPAAILVQGDTVTTLAGAMVGFYNKIPVGHVEAGLRSDDPLSPFPEEMNRRLISPLARLHFAATQRNVDRLLAEGIPQAWIALTGNPVVDAVSWTLKHKSPSPQICALLDSLRGKRLVVLTTHRRESFGETMAARLRVLREFITKQSDLELIFPVHPNPEVRKQARTLLAGAPRIHLLDPLDYFDFIHLLANAWLIVSDSGGIQEEAPSLHKPVIVIRENTERPEAIEAGVARLTGAAPERLRELLEETLHDSSWFARVREATNPFGCGDSGVQIACALKTFFASSDRSSESLLQ